MKPSVFQIERMRWWASLIPCVLATTAMAGDTNTPPAAVEGTNAPPAVEGTNAPVAEAAEPLTPEQFYEGGTNNYTNWLTLSSGGFMTTGNKAQAQRQQQSRSGVFGGIEDFHYQGDVSKGTTLAIDGHEILDPNDYKLSFDLKREKLGYLRFSASQYRTWSIGDGGYFKPSDLYLASPYSSLGLDRSEYSLEGGLTLENKPKVTFKYTHSGREGQKDSTISGISHPSTGSPPIGSVGISPSFYDINERSDSIALDVTHHIKSTDFGIGVRYEHGTLDDALKVYQYKGEPIQTQVTDRQGTTYDMFNVHAFTETWLKKNVLFSTGYSYTWMNTDFSGSRLSGNDFDVGLAPLGANSAGYFGMTGGSDLNEYAMNVNLMYRPTPNWSIAPSLRAMKQDTDSDSLGSQDASSSFSSYNENSQLDVTERIDVRYTGVTNWVYYGRTEWTEGDGTLKDHQLTDGVTIGGTGISPFRQNTEDTRFFEKYTLGTRWYPLRRLSVDVGTYFKDNRYDYDHNVDTTLNDPSSYDRYPAYLRMQRFDTTDGNARVTYRPVDSVTLVSRYEYQYSTIDTRPDDISGLGEVQSSRMTSHIIGEDVSWTPWSRVYFQAGCNYVLSKTHTPASDVTEAILDSQNNYWTVNFNTGYVIDDKTDVKLGYIFYRADDYRDNSSIGLPLGSGATEHSATVTLTRKIRKNLRLITRYGFFHYEDALYGGYRNFDAHLIYSSLQYRF